ncbi:glucokinase [Aquimarina sp. MAR_2010_214]|uniref:ROK family protein n=1 Tax=Aquimarina sp. MAR_2010_214 TaxID=1250026 RepID=UPI000C70355B|nr:ROK family protein [Aquimarina sp. MAR_2010_214]PKV52397.1 glucokinase [Aquimarina sp. MAR_2010_214]
MILGVDIGGSHITVARIDIKNHEIPDSNLISTKVDSTAQANEIIDQWIHILQKSIDSLNEDKESLEGLCIALPGPFDYYQGIFAYKMENKFTALLGINIKKIIIERLALSDTIPLRFYNDAACFGIGESWKGKLKSAEKALAITLGTGFGATFLSQGLPMLSGDGVPENGELYNIPFKNGIADEYFSSRWFIKKYKEATGITISGVKDLITDTKSSPHTDQIFEEFSRNLAIFLSPWLKGYNADAVVIGGNISKAWNSFADNLNAELKNQGCNTKIYQSELKEKAILLGGARLVNNIFYESLCF